MFSGLVVCAQVFIVQGPSVGVFVLYSRHAAECCIACICELSHDLHAVLIMQQMCSFTSETRKSMSVVSLLLLNVLR